MSMGMKGPSSGGADLLQGTLDVLILQSLSGRSMHGFGIARWIEQTSGNALSIEEGSLYPALHRLELKGWLSSQWKPSEHKRRARYYRLTASGRRRLAIETSSWRSLVQAVGRILKAGRRAAESGS